MWVSEGTLVTQAFGLGHLDVLDGQMSDHMSVLWLLLSSVKFKGAFDEIWPVQMVMGDVDEGPDLPQGLVTVCGVRSTSGLLPLGPCPVWVSVRIHARSGVGEGQAVRGHPIPRLLLAQPVPAGGCARPRHEALVRAGSRVGSPPGAQRWLCLLLRLARGPHSLQGESRTPP